MFLNSETDYAIRIISCLAAENKIMLASTISEKTGVTKKYSLKILHKLSCAGFVSSKKGPNGGYFLAKKPENISLLEIIELMCGPISFNKCQTEEAVCTHPQGVCYFRDTFDDVSEYMIKKFGSENFKRSK